MADPEDTRHRRLGDRNRRPPVRMVRPVQRGGKQGALDAGRDVLRNGDAPFGGDACRIRRRAARPERPGAGPPLRRPLREWLRPLPRRPRRAAQPDLPPHDAGAAIPCRQGGRLEAAGAVLDHAARHQICRHAGLAGPAAQGRTVGGCRLSAAAQRDERGRISRPRFRSGAGRRSRPGGGADRPGRSAGCRPFCPIC